jgi:hypothetical protein
VKPLYHAKISLPLFSVPQADRRERSAAVRRSSSRDDTLLSHNFFQNNTEILIETADF